MATTAEAAKSPTPNSALPMANLIIAESNWVIALPTFGLRRAKGRLGVVGTAGSGRDGHHRGVDLGALGVVHRAWRPRGDGAAVDGLAHPVATIDTSANDATSTLAPDMPTCGALITDLRRFNSTDTAARRLSARSGVRPSGTA